MRCDTFIYRCDTIIFMRNLTIRVWDRKTNKSENFTIETELTIGEVANKIKSIKIGGE